MITDTQQIPKIQMVDLVTQYQRIKPEIEEAIAEVLDSAWFIKGPVVKRFEEALASYCGVKHAIGVANGTDALQVALMAIGCVPGDEVIVPTFTYVATAEVIALLGLKPVMVDVDPDTFNVTADIIEKAITPKTKAIVPVHLFGQNSDMEPIVALAKKHGLYVIEDNAQAIGSEYTWSDGTQRQSGTMGHIGTTSFFPSKNLGCFGDGGAMVTNDDNIADKIRMVANHGQIKKYHHQIIGVNSRLDALQAAILDVKLKYLDEFCSARQKVAATYDSAFADTDGLTIPYRQHNSTHVFHQYTLKVSGGRRDALKEHLKEKGIPSMVYYPIPLYKQEAFKEFYNDAPLPVTEALCQSVISLPIHTEMQADTQNYIIDSVQAFFA